MSVTHAVDAPDLALTPLDSLHRSLGARMVPFAGYAMPVQYPLGIIGEHFHTRTKAGLFDVSHMGQALLEGPAAAARLETLVPGDIQGLGPGRMRYTQFLDQHGHILDDLIVTRLPDDGPRERLFLVVNAAVKAADFAHIAAALPDLKLSIMAGHALLALQGPKAVEVLRRRLHDAKADESESQALARMPFMSARAFDLGGLRLGMSRSGYTGEDGFEISLAQEAAAAFAQDLVGDPDVLPVGLGARDSLRLEAGLCLYGHDIDMTTDPVEAGLMWSISKRRCLDGGFPGAGAIGRAIAEGPSRRRVGLLIEGKAPAREGAEIMQGDKVIGRLTSGGFSPSLGRPIAMGYVEAAYAAQGESVEVMLRGKPVAAKVAATPFVPHKYYGGA
jgi:aminomethyltransferase